MFCHSALQDVHLLAVIRESKLRGSSFQGLVSLLAPSLHFVLLNICILSSHEDKSGGVPTTISMHCGFKIFKMAAKVEEFEFRRLYALFFYRYSSFLRSFFSIS